MKNILIVEDENIIALDIRRSVNRLGYNVAGVVPSGEEAIKQALQAKPDLILMDITLRGKIDGTQAAAYITKHYQVPIIYITSYFDESYLSAKTGAYYSYDIILKPFNEKELQIKIENALFRVKKGGEQGRGSAAGI